MTLRSLLLSESCNVCVIVFHPPYVQSRPCFRISQSGMTLWSLLLPESCNMCVIVFHPPYVQSRLCFRISQSWHDLTGSVCVPCPYGYFLKAVINYVCNCLPFSIHLYIHSCPCFRLSQSCHDLASKFVRLVAKPGTNYIEDEDLVPFLQVTHGGLGPDCQSNETV